ncbi:type II secretion system protein GspD [Thermosulfurimonas sp. F29]|uniref:type II secretion system protein GspD n=1 Tax=Thermosulfurimonas sp. F29 TaxID=2867247 RepID=UPI001C8373BC|nr:type II and III secretion system protein [Thermosulfurimonas sp. F29]MBX6424111.1 type II and III secretion system protein [Thermosulfurimonas sp. F29]
MWKGRFALPAVFGVFLVFLFFGCQSVPIEREASTEALWGASPAYRVLSRTVEVDLVKSTPVSVLVRTLCENYGFTCDFTHEPAERYRVRIKGFKGPLAELLRLIQDNTGLVYRVDSAGVLRLVNWRSVELAAEAPEVTREPEKVCRKPIVVRFSDTPLAEVFDYFAREFGYSFTFDFRYSPGFASYGKTKTTLTPLGKQRAEFVTKPAIFPGGKTQTGVSDATMAVKSAGEEEIAPWKERVTYFYQGCSPEEALEGVLRTVDLKAVSQGDKRFVVRDYDELVLDRSVFFNYSFSLGGTGTVSSEEESTTSSGAGTGVSDATSAAPSSASGSEATATSGIAGTGAGEETMEVSFDENVISDLKSRIKALLSSRGKVIYSPRGYIVVVDRPSIIRSVREVLLKERSKDRRIRLRVRIVRIDLSREFQAGVDWNLLIRSFGDIQNLRVFTSYADAVHGGTGVQFAYKGAKQVLRFLEKYGKVRIVREFVAVGRTGFPVMFKAVDRIPYATSVVTTTETQTQTFPQVNTEEVGMKLVLLPNVEGARVDLSVAVSVSEYLGDKTFNLGDAGTVVVPLVTKSDVYLPARVALGETLFITGFKIHKTELEDQGAPLLSRLPVAGALFGYGDRKHENSELLIMITPEEIS